MKNIEFRGKRLDNNEWIYGYFVKNRNGKCYIIKNKNTDFYEIDSKTVGQFIGIKDIHNKKIYEGDIVKAKWGDITESIGIVYFFEGTFIGIKNYDPDNLPTKQWTGNMWFFSFDGYSDNPITVYEIIGNIFK